MTASRRHLVFLDFGGGDRCGGVRGVRLAGDGRPVRPNSGAARARDCRWIDGLRHVRHAGPGATARRPRTRPEIRIPLEPSVAGEPWIVASFPSTRARAERATPGKLLEIDLQPFTDLDDPTYRFEPPGRSTSPTSASECAHCHAPISKGLEASAHATAASNPKLHDPYAGTRVRRTRARARPTARRQITGSGRIEPAVLHPGFSPREGESVVCGPAVRSDGDGVLLRDARGVRPRRGRARRPRRDRRSALRVVGLPSGVLQEDVAVVLMRRARDLG